MKRKNEGITLVAVVVTIIVLLILVAITMTLVLGQNGILTRAKQATDQTREAQDAEKVDLFNLEKEIKKYDGVTNTTDKNPGELSGAGNAEDPYLIESIEDLVKLGQDVNNGNTYEGKVLRLALSLDFNDNESYVDPRSTEFGDYNGNGTVEELRTELTTGKGWAPIGTYDNHLKGDLDGNNKQILNIYMNRSTDEYLTSDNMNGAYGFFGYHEGLLNNLSASGNVTYDIKALANNVHLYIGGLVGYKSGKSENITGNINVTVNKTDTSTIKLYSYIGGLFGENYKSMFSCVNNGNVKLVPSDQITVRGYVGGVAGLSINDKRVNIVNNGQIEMYDCIWGFVGGVVGHGYSGEFENILNTGKVIGKSSVNSGLETRVGGVIGLNEGTKVNMAKNKGEVYAERNDKVSGDKFGCGGVVGGAKNGFIYNSINEGNITFNNNCKYSSNVGGIVGLIFSGTYGGKWDICNNINKGNIQVTDSNTDAVTTHVLNVAGILGRSTYFVEDQAGICNFKNNYNEGNIAINWNQTAGVKVAGLYGDNDNQKIDSKNLMNKGNIQVDDNLVSGRGFISGTPNTFNSIDGVFVENNVTYSGDKRSGSSAEAAITRIDMTPENVINQMNSGLESNYCSWIQNNGSISLEY